HRTVIPLAEGRCDCGSSADGHGLAQRLGQPAGNVPLEVVDAPRLGGNFRRNRTVTHRGRRCGVQYLAERVAVGLGRVADRVVQTERPDAVTRGVRGRGQLAVAVDPLLDLVHHG